MSQAEKPNPEHRSSNAMLCFCLGAGLCIAAYVLGIGAMMGALLAGNDPAVIVGGLFAVIGLALLGASGFVLLVIGAIWMVVRVIADQAGDAGEKRYRDVER